MSKRRIMKSDRHQRQCKASQCHVLKKMTFYCFWAISKTLQLQVTGTYKALAPSTKFRSTTYCCQKYNVVQRKGTQPQIL